MKENDVRIVALWLNKKGSVSALCQEQVANDSLIGQTTRRATIINSCIHPFSLELCSKMLNVDIDHLKGTSTELKYRIDISANEVFKKKLRIQTIEAYGEEEAIKIGILNGTEDSEKYYRKRNKMTNSDERINDKYVYRKTRLAPSYFEDIKINYAGILKDAQKQLNLDSNMMEWSEDELF
jgi:hypothetical protein